MYERLSNLISTVKDERLNEKLLQRLEPEIREISARQAKELVRQAEERGVRHLVKTLRELGYDDEEIRKAISKGYTLSEKEMKKYM